MLKKSKVVITALIFMLLTMTQAWAVSQDPLAMLQSNSDKVLSELAKHKEGIQKKHDVLYRIVDEILLPHIDIERITRSVIGREAWQTAAQKNKDTFVHEFVQLLIKTYASALSAYDDQKIHFLPLREPVGNKRYIEIYSEVLHSQGPRIPVNYRLIKQQGQWKVYDFSIDGVSFVKSYRSQFAAALSQGGLTHLLARLKAHNQATK